MSSNTLEKQPAGAMLDCDGCGKPMNAETYQQHACRAYRTNKYRNPFEHKLAAADWKKPQGTINAKGSSIPQFTPGRRFVIEPRPFPWLEAIGLLALAAIVGVTLYFYG